MNIGGPFSGTRRSFMYRLYGGHRSFPRAVLARSARMERARSKITRMPHPRYTHTGLYILYLDPVLEPVLFLFIFCFFSFDEQTLLKSSLVQHIVYVLNLYMYICSWIFLC